MQQRKEIAIEGRFVATSQDQIAGLFGVDRRKVVEWVARGMPGRPKCYELAAVIPWVRENVWVRGSKGDEDSGSDALLNGSNSPALEKYREERAKLARLDRVEREGQLIRRDAAHEALMRIAEIIRNAGDSLQRQFGPEAHSVLADALADAEREIDEFFSGRSGNGYESSF